MSFTIEIPGGRSSVNVDAEYAEVDGGILKLQSRATGLVAAFSEWVYFKKEEN